MAAFQFVDSHAHLADPAFDADRDNVIARAKQSGCTRVVCIGESLASAERASALAALHPDFISWTAGVHPHDAAAFDDVRDGDAIRGCIARGAVAIGECGLDYHYDNAPRDVQRRVLAAHLAIAHDTGRPLVVHTRDAEDDMLACIKDAHQSRVIGVLHCFTGGPALAEAALSAGWYVSFAGMVTFKKWDGDSLVRMVPDDRLLVETDSPYLAPVPNRGKRNEPANVAFVVQRLADIRGQSAAGVGALVSANAERCFALAPTTNAV